MDFDAWIVCGNADTTGLADLSLPAAGDAVDISIFVQGLYRICRERFDADTCHDILDDTVALLLEAGYSTWHHIGRPELAAIILVSTRDWEYVGDSGTIDVVRTQRDYTRSVVGEAHFWNCYQGMQTVDGASFFATVQ